MNELLAERDVPVRMLAIAGVVPAWLEDRVGRQCSVSTLTIACENLDATIDFKPGETSGEDAMVVNANGGKTIRTGRRVETKDVR
jgi:hypothetical protein